jgi:hypothetical protein
LQKAENVLGGLEYGYKDKFSALWSGEKVGTENE